MKSQGQESWVHQRKLVSGEKITVLFTVAHYWGSSGPLPLHRRLLARYVWAGWLWDRGTPHLEKTSCHLKLSASLPGCKCRLCRSETVTGNSRGRPQHWGISDTHPVASAPLVKFLCVTKGPEGDEESFAVFACSSAAPSVPPVYLTLRLKRIDVWSHDARQVRSSLRDCQTVL